MARSGRQKTQVRSLWSGDDLFVSVDDLAANLLINGDAQAAQDLAAFREFHRRERTASVSEEGSEG